MKLKTVFFIILILIVAFTAFTQNIDFSSVPLEVYDYDYNNELMEIPMIYVEMEVLHSIPVGSGEFELGYFYEDIQGGMTTCPHDMLLTDDWIYFFDDYNRRMVAFSRDFKEFKDLGNVFQFDFANYLDGNENYLISSGCVYSHDEKKNLIQRNVFAYDNIHPEYDLNPYYFNFVEDRFLILDNRGREGLVLLDLELDNSSFDNVMYDEDAERYLNEHSMNIEVIDGRYILYDDVLTTKSVVSFVKYFREFNSQINYSSEFMFDYLSNFCGVDNDGNYYWHIYDNQIFLFGEDGCFVTSIQYSGEFVENLVIYHFSVDGEGNIYSLAIDEQRENYKLLRIKRSW